MPPGHFYSPIPNVNEIKERKESIFNRKKEPGNINTRIEEQIQFLESCQHYYNQIPFPEEQSSEFRYYFNNTMFTYADAISLYLIINHFQPKKIIEVGSGFSSAVMLDTCDFHNHINAELTFIEPFPDRLNSLLNENESINLHETIVQNTNLEIYKKLEAGDILFIDSSHVSKAGSDVNYIFFEIFPILKPGVVIHVHDIGINFQYPYKWIEQGRSWNESYLLRAFLMNNIDYEILLFNAQVYNRKRKFFEDKMPLYTKGPGGSFWMRKVA